MALFLTAPVLAVLIESVLDLPEKAALIILSLSFMAAVAGKAPLKGLMIGVLGMLLALMGSTLSGNGPRMTFGIPELGNGLPLSSAILGVLIVGEVFIGIEDAARDRLANRKPVANSAHGDNRFRLSDIKKIMPIIFSSTLIGTAIGALPGIGTTLAATLGYDVAKRFSRTPEKYGTGIPEGVAATEAANSSVSGANLIPVMSWAFPEILQPCSSFWPLNPLVISPWDHRSFDSRKSRKSRATARSSTRISSSHLPCSR